MLPTLTCVSISAAADVVNADNVSVVASRRGPSSVWIQWTDPPSPNGLILLYDVELSRVEVSNVSLPSFCLYSRCLLTKIQSVEEIAKEADETLFLKMKCKQRCLNPTLPPLKPNTHAASSQGTFLRAPRMTASAP